MPADAAMHPHSCNCLALRQAARHVTQFYDQHLAAAGLRTTQFSILAKLKGFGPMNINALARELVMDRTTLGRTMLPLERDGLIRIEDSAVDRRSKELQLTKAGAERLRTAAKLWKEAQNQFEKAVGSERASRLRTELRSLVSSDLGGPPNPSSAVLRQVWPSRSTIPPCRLFFVRDCVRQDRPYLSSCTSQDTKVAMRSFGKKPNGLRLERIKASPRWVGESFRNIHPVLPRLIDPSASPPTASEFLCAGDRRVPQGPLPSLNPIETWLKRPGSGLRATWLGHSTVLIEIDGLRVLTDPVWGLRASPSQLIGPKRFQPVPIALAELPPLDVVVVSHDHYDHLDYTTIRELARLEVPFVTSLGVGSHLEAWGVAPERITELDWWESHTLPAANLTLTAAPSQHFSGRRLNDRNATLWSSMVIRSQKHTVFFSGDTGLTTEYATIRDRLGPFDLVMLEVGAFHPSWGHIHLGPENALEALELLGGGAFLPVHWGTFALAMHAWDQPAETLLSLAPKRGARLVMPRLGEPVEPDHAERLTAWWRVVDGVPGRLRVEPRLTLPNTTPWPID